MNTESTIPRLVANEELDGYSSGHILEVTTAITMILSTPQQAADRADAIAMATGQGEEWRFHHTIRVWEANPRLRYLLVTSGNPAERTYAEVTLDYVRGFGLRRTDGLLLQPDPAPNTGGQAAWIAEQVQGRGITSIALTTSPYHLPRFYLTVLKELARRSIRIPIVPAPAAVAPQTPIPEADATSYDLVSGEVRRILTDMDRGGSPHRRSCGGTCPGCGETMGLAGPQIKPLRAVVRLRLVTSQRVAPAARVRALRVARSISPA